MMKFNNEIYGEIYHKCEKNNHNLFMSKITLFFINLIFYIYIYIYIIMFL